MGRILVVDDHDSLRKGLVRALANAGHDVEEAANGTLAIERLQDSQFDVVLTDLRMGGADGMDVLRTTRSIQPSAAVILMTAFGSIHTAVEAMKIGAFDFVQKPFEIEEMELKIEKAIELRHLKYQVEYLRHEQQDIYDFDRIVGASGALQQVLTIVKKVARSNSTVLIKGETGTGKELIAGAIHHNSHRANRAFVKVNCAALQENLLESELFGHEKGAFTSADKQRIGRFEQADGGTLFLDEIGDIPVSTQVKLLRFLEGRTFSRVGGTEQVTVDVRLISATNSDLEERVASGAFREDLFFRLNVVRIETPPLRDRRDDVALLVAHFVELWGAEGISQDALEILRNYPWPGNVRELRNAIERGVVLSRKRTILPEHLPESVLRPRSPGGAGTDARVAELVDAIALAPDAPRTGLFRVVEEKWERALLRRALEMTGGNQVRAAHLLGINRLTLRKKIARYGL